MQLEQRVSELVNEKISDRPDLFLVDIRMLPNHTLLIHIDGDQGLNIQDCVNVSRHVGFHLEEENAVENAYKLEVSSPGVGEPLKIHRQYLKNIGRDLGITMLDGTKREGKLAAVSELEITLEEKIKEKGKKAKIENHQIAFSDIKETKVLISFK
jgi:ribosome maturation factor RimP